MYRFTGHYYRYDNEKSIKDTSMLILRNFFRNYHWATFAIPYLCRCFNSDKSELVSVHKDCYDIFSLAVQGPNNFRVLTRPPAILHSSYS